MSLVLKNRTTGKIICKDLKLAKSFKDRLFGLLVKSNPRSILFKTRFGIHTFFLKEPVDVIVMNDNYKIVKIKQNLKPNRLFFWNPVYPFVLELPKGSIDKLSLRQTQTLLIC